MKHALTALTLALALAGCKTDGAFWRDVGYNVVVQESVAYTEACGGYTALGVAAARTDRGTSAADGFAMVMPHGGLCPKAANAPRKLTAAERKQVADSDFWTDIYRLKQSTHAFAGDGTRIDGR